MLSKRVFLRPSITGAIALAAALTALPAQAQRMSFDGPWSVLILGDQGSCQGQAYRYGVQIASGQVFSRSCRRRHLRSRHAARAGAVSAFAKAVRKQSAAGASRTFPAGGYWSGGSPGQQCAGRWMAERRVHY